MANYMNLLATLLLCVLSLKPVFAQDPIVTIRDSQPKFVQGTLVQKRVDGILSSDVTLDCFVEYNTKYDVQWRRIYETENGLQSEAISSDKSVEDNIRYGIEKPTPNTWRLRLRAVTKAMEGLFECYVIVQHHSEKVDRVLVQVFQYPEISRQATSTDESKTAGQPLTLRCDAVGIPEPTIEWSRQGGRLLPSPNNREKFVGKELKITSAEADDRGYYKCDAYNLVGRTSANIHLDVKFQPIVRAINPRVGQKPGYRIELQCLIEANPAPRDEELRWIKFDRTFSVTSGSYQINIIRGAFDRLTYELIIDGVKDDDYGQFRCEAKNILGTRRANVDLIETEEPQPSYKTGIVVAKGSSIWPYISLVLLSTLLAALLQLM